MKKYKVLIADDHHISRQGLQTLLEYERDFEVVALAKNGAEAVEKTATFLPDIVLMDIKMPKLDGLTACGKIKAFAPQTAVLMLSVYGHDDDIFKAIEVGACGYLLKDVEQEDLIKALRLAGEGLCFLHPTIAKKMFQRLSASSEPEKAKNNGLTGRELEILGLMAQSLNNEGIAKKLWVTKGTVKTHVSNILHKLKVSDRSQAVITAHRMGLIKKVTIPTSNNEEKN